MAIPPTGVVITNTRIITFRITGGKIVEAWENYDMLGVLQQLGVMPPTRDTYTWGEPSSMSRGVGKCHSRIDEVHRINNGFSRRFMGYVMVKFPRPTQPWPWWRFFAPEKGHYECVLPLPDSSCFESSLCAASW